MAHVFIYPSYFEGFGIPIIEAQQMGIPVITTKGSAFQEAGGQGALYGNPDDTDTLIKNIELLSDETHRQTMIERGFQNIRRFDQRVISRQLMQIYEEVLEPSVLRRPVLVGN